nr:MAG TPA: hypothetical protein [Caudoviricetes sp.]
MTWFVHYINRCLNKKFTKSAVKNNRTFLRLKFEITAKKE